MRWSARSSVLMVALAGAGVLASADAAAQTPLLQVTGLSGGQPYGLGSLAFTDYDAQPVNIANAFGGPGIHLDNTYYATLYVSTDGLIADGMPVAEMYNFPEPSLVKIAPWFADVDLTNASPTSGAGIFWHVGPLDVNGSGPPVFMITWNQVGYAFGHQDRLNSFQLVLTSRTDIAPGDFDAEFRYSRCEWSSGDTQGGDGGLGGMAAVAGFDFTKLPSGFSTTLQPPGSDPLQLCGTSNVGQPGIYRFAGRNGVVQPCTAAGCDQPDAGFPDAGFPDAGFPDAGFPDAGFPDAGFPDAGISDGSVPDGSHVDHYAGGGFCSCRAAGSGHTGARTGLTTALLAVAAGLAGRRGRKGAGR